MSDSVEIIFIKMTLKKLLYQQYRRHHNDIITRPINHTIEKVVEVSGCALVSLVLEGGVGGG